MTQKREQVSAKHFSIGQLRVDYWNSLRNQCQKLATAESRSEKEENLLQSMNQLLVDLRTIEQYFVFPGKNQVEKLGKTLNRKEYQALLTHVTEITRSLVSDDQAFGGHLEERDENGSSSGDDQQQGHAQHERINFEVLFVESMSKSEELSLQDNMHRLRSADDPFTFEVSVQPSFQDALIAILFNQNIQAVVIRYAPTYASDQITDLIRPFIQNILNLEYELMAEENLGPLLGKVIKRFRPELDAYYVTDTSLSDLKDSTIQTFRRIYYRREDFQELHLGILRGVSDRFDTPFFTALKEYSKKPMGIFHAMPISRGNSVFRSHWIQDFGEFYGRNLFLAENSSTTGGMDSLLQPTGNIKKAQEMAAVAYGSQRSFFVTNGTSTANKIVLQALVVPGDLVLIDRDCHKSHHYGMVLSGAYPVYLDSYPIEKYSMYGAVPLALIKEKLKVIKEAGRLDKVKMLLLTNCSFDGMVYNVERVMEEILAIKPDMIFLWDEAWFAYAGFTYTFKQRTGMFNAKRLREKYNSPEYRVRYDKHVASLKKGEIPTLPDPDKVRIRVYSTQSTHKTLSSFRQGSMIHIWDEDYRKKSENTFLEAYMTHTSTSPNYQMLASLDVGRRQVQLEGYAMVEKSIEMAMVFRAKVIGNPLLSKYFDVLTIKDFIPDTYRQSGLGEYFDKEKGWNRMETAWEQDEFMLDPTKITLFIGRTGVDGDTFKNKYLMDQFNIQINKTSRNTVLLMTNIGTTRGSVAYLTNALLQIARQLDEEFLAMNVREKEISDQRIRSLTEEVPPLPDFSRFHASFQAVPGVPGGNLREAYFMSYDENNFEYKTLQECKDSIEAGRELVASSFVIPYPPGFPVLVPGQVVSMDIMRFMMALDVTEIHGFRADLGLRIFRDSVLNRQQTGTALGAMGAMGRSNGNGITPKQIK